MKKKPFRNLPNLGGRITGAIYKGHQIKTSRFDCGLGWRCRGTWSKLLIVRLGKVGHCVRNRLEHLSGVDGGRAGIDCKRWHVGPLGQNRVVGDEAAVLEVAVASDHTVAADVDEVADVGRVDDRVLAYEDVFADCHRIEGNTARENGTLVEPRWLRSILLPFGELLERWPNHRILADHTVATHLDGGQVTSNDASLLDDSLKEKGIGNQIRPNLILQPQATFPKIMILCGPQRTERRQTLLPEAVSM